VLTKEHVDKQTLKKIHIKHRIGRSDDLEGRFMLNLLMVLFSVLIFCAGILAGVIAAWQYSRSARAVLTDRVETRDRRLQQKDTEVKALRDQINALLGLGENRALTAKETELTELLERERISAAEKLSTALQAAEDRLLAFKEAANHTVAVAEKAAAEKLIASEKAAVTRLAEVQRAAEQRLATTQTAAQEKVALLEEARQKLSDSFQTLSAEALKNNNQAFLQLAKEALEQHHAQAEGELQKRHKAIEQIVEPLSESLGKVHQQIQEMEKVRKGAYDNLSDQVRTMTDTQTRLQTETANLANALRAPQARGRWGEVQLQRVVELAGMLERCDFDRQPSTETDDGRLRPDLIVHLPWNKSIVVDAKAPLNAYLEAVEASDDETRTLKFKEHAAQIRSHMNHLASKSYYEQFQPAPEFVVMFLPGESVFSAALQQDPGLIENGPQQGVILATPTTLIALLKAVAYGWRQEVLAENAQRIADLGSELYDRLFKFHDHFFDLKKNLDNAVASFNGAAGSFEGRVMVTARKFRDLNGGLPQEIEVLEGLERTTRPVKALDIGLEVPALADTKVA
jgi:DNA recombination protein RmuC